MFTARDVNYCLEHLVQLGRLQLEDGESRVVSPFLLIAKVSNKEEKIREELPSDP